MELGSERSALQHAQDLHRSSLKIFLVFFAIARGAFWGRNLRMGFYMAMTKQAVMNRRPK